MGSRASYFLTPTLKEKEHEIVNEARIHFRKNGFDGMNSFYKRKMDSWKNVPLKFALTGSCDEGRSSFMDMLRSHEIDVRYIHPEHKNIIEFYDFPGIETSPNFQTFCNDIGGLIKYDAFLIFCTSQLTNREIKLAENFAGDFAMPFVFIEENVDCGMKSREKIDRLKSPINFVRSGSDIYIMKDDDGIYPLVEEITSKLIKRRKEYFIRYFNDEIFKKKEFSQQERLMAEIKAVVNKRGVDGIDELYKELIETLEKPELNLLITGNAGTGKSSFINAVRGLKANDPGAAKVGIRETTKKPAFYQHPKMKEIMFHDVPGIGTRDFPDIQEYCMQINLHEYDAFLIFSKERFTEIDKELAEAISKEFKKPFFFVRTNIDQDIKDNFDDFGITVEEIKQEIMNHCEKNLKGLVTNKDIFLIDNRAPDKHDFQRLKDSILEKLLTKKNDDVKRFIIDLLTNESTEFVRLKANILRGTIPGTTRVLNIRYYFSKNKKFRKMIIAQVNLYREEFGLASIDSLKESDMELAVKNPSEFLETCINDLEIEALKNCQDFDNDENDYSTEEDDRIFHEKFLNDEYDIRDDVHTKLRSLPWMRGEYGTVGPNEKIPYAHVFVTVDYDKGSYDEDDLKNEIDQILGNETSKYVEFRTKSSEKPKLELLSNIAVRRSNELPIRGTLTMFCYHNDKHYALTCFHVGYNEDNIDQFPDMLREVNNHPNRVSLFLNSNEYFYTPPENLLEDRLGHRCSFYSLENDTDIMAIDVDENVRVNCRRRGINHPRWSSLWQELHKRVNSPVTPNPEVMKLGGRNNRKGEISVTSYGFFDEETNIDIKNAVLVKSKKHFLLNGESGVLVFFIDKNEEKQAFGYGVARWTFEKGDPEYPYRYICFKLQKALRNLFGERNFESCGCFELCANEG